MGKVQLIYVMHPSVPFTYGWPISWQCCPTFEQRGCGLFSTRCQNYGWRFPLFTSFQLITWHERSRGTLKGILHSFSKEFPFLIFLSRCRMAGQTPQARYVSGQSSIYIFNYITKGESPHISPISVVILSFWKEIAFLCCGKS